MEHNILLLLSFFLFFRNSLEYDCKLEKTTMSKLKDNIFCNYDSSLRPVNHHSNKTVVSLSLYPRHIDLEEERNILYVHTWIYMTWKDNNINWEPAEYENITYLNVAPNYLWVPDLCVYNKYDVDLDIESHPAVLVYSGRVHVVVMSDFTAYCSMDLTYWPNDEQNCTAMLGSRSYTGSFLDFKLNDATAVSLKNYLSNREWKLKSVIATRDVTKLGSARNGSDSVYLVTIRYQFNVKRHPTFVIATVFIPVLLLSLLVLLPLLLPFSSERCYNTLALSAIGHVSYLQYLGYILPHNADNSVLIVAYIRDSLVMAVFALIMCVFIDKITSIAEIPLWLCNILKSLQSTKYTRLLLTLQDEIKQKTEEDVNLVNPDVLCSSKDWLTLSLLIQRLIFIIYLILYIIMLISFL